jgi:hypothetical protein
MFINIQITLQEGDAPPTQTPADILTSLGGDPAKDSISVSVNATHSPPPVQQAPPS